MSYHLSVKTTTMPNRNLDTLLRVKELCRKEGDKKLRILEVGPGMALRGYGRLNGKGRGLPFKRLETVLRRLPLPVWCYENFETGEILDVFGDKLDELVVCDISRKSLDVIDYCYKDHRVVTKHLDLSQPVNDTKLGLPFDIVICMATVVRIPQELRGVARKNLASLCGSGGFVITEQGMSSLGYVNVGKNIFQNGANEDARS